MGWEAGMCNGEERKARDKDQEFCDGIAKVASLEYDLIKTWLNFKPLKEADQAGIYREKPFLQRDQLN